MREGDERRGERRRKENRLWYGEDEEEEESKAELTKTGYQLLILETQHRFG